VPKPQARCNFVADRPSSSSASPSHPSGLAFTAILGAVLSTIKTRVADSKVVQYRLLIAVPAVQAAERKVMRQGQLVKDCHAPILLYRQHQQKDFVSTDDRARCILEVRSQTMKKKYPDECSMTTISR
jgi:hypothetical protein